MLKTLQPFECCMTWWMVGITYHSRVIVLWSTRISTQIRISFGFWGFGTCTPSWWVSGGVAWWGSLKISSSWKLILFTYIYMVFCGIFHLKTCKTSSAFTWEELYVCTGEKLLQSLQVSTNFETSTISQPVKTNSWTAPYALRFLLSIPYHAIWWCCN